MKNKLLLIFLLSIFLVGCTQIPSNIDTDGDMLIIGEDYTIESRERISQNLAIIGSNVVIEEDAVIYGDINAIGSNITIFGAVIGDLNAFAGSATLESSGHINGNINQVYHQIDIQPGSEFNGEIKTYTKPFSFLPPLSNFNNFFFESANPTRAIINRLVFTGFLTLLVIFAVLVFPNPTRKIANTIRNATWVSWGMGCLFYIAIPIIVIILAITICLSPIAVAMLLLFGIGIIYGWIALAYICGRKIDQWLYAEMHETVQGLVGSLAIGLLLSLLSLIPCFGVLAILFISCFGLGGVVLSRFGLREEKKEKPERSLKQQKMAELVENKKK